MNVEESASRLVSWIKERVTAASCKGVVVGMSGGLDSSVVAVLCQRAFPQTTLGVLMPCHSSPEDTEHAQLVASQFSIPTRMVVLNNIYDTLLKALPDEGDDPATKSTAQANLKPRLRMLTLYYLANRLKYLVAGSSNRSELAVGYFTKYGDSGVDMLPLGDLVKREVRELADFLSIPQQIIDKPPSAGLWPGQTDEDELGLTYEALDNYLTGGTISDDLKQKIESRVRASRHKFQLPPIAEIGY
jgi:NAD+ synthase